MRKEELYKDVVNGMGKEDICDFLGLSKKETRSTSVKTVREMFEEKIRDEDEFRKACEMYPEETAVPAYRIESILECSKTERLRWTEEEKLPVLFYKTVRSEWGGYVDAPYFSQLYLHDQINDEIIAKWRLEHVEEVARNRKAGRVKAQKTKMKHDEMRQEALKKHLEDLEEWTKHGEEVKAAMNLAFWTMIVNHMAKTGDGNDWWYAYKEKAIKVLCQFPCSKVEFYRPDKPDYCIEIVHDEYDEYDEYGNYRNRYRYHSYFDDSDSEYECEQILVEKDYYSLYSIEVGVEGCTPFKFHLPYPIGKSFLPDPETIPHVKQYENGGRYRFGRALTDEEEIIYKEGNVKKMFEEAMDKAEKCISLVEK